MRVYVDSSVVLRIVLWENGRLREWSRVTAAMSSELVRVECLRVLDRLRLTGGLRERELARRRASAMDLIGGFELVRMNRAVLDRASLPFPTLVHTLDAIHLATALLLEGRQRPTRFATHDETLATAALAVGLHVIGV